jgi:hypothetical protein
MNAAMEICMLIRMPSALVKHTPFFTCAINLAAVVYLSYWSFLVTENVEGLVKEHIKLNIGSLKTLSKVMPIANTVLGQAKGVAKDLFRSRKALNNLYMGAVSREDILQRMIDLPDEDASALVLEQPGFFQVSQAETSQAVVPVSLPLSIQDTTTQVVMQGGEVGPLAQSTSGM